MSLGITGELQDEIWSSKTSSSITLRLRKNGLYVIPLRLTQKKNRNLFAHSQWEWTLFGSLSSVFPFLVHRPKPLDVNAQDITTMQSSDTWVPEQRWNSQLLFPRATWTLSMAIPATRSIERQPCPTKHPEEKTCQPKQTAKQTRRVEQRWRMKDPNDFSYLCELPEAWMSFCPWILGCSPVSWL